MKILLLVLLVLPLFPRWTQQYDRYGAVPSQNTIQEIHRYYGLRLSASGGSSPCGIRKLNLGFEIQREPTVDEARRLLVACAEIYLKNINTSLNTRLFLIEYPFPIKRISLSINVHHSIHPVAFSSAQIANGKFTCNSYSPKWTVVHEEPFETSLQIVRDEISLKTPRGNI